MCIPSLLFYLFESMAVAVICKLNCSLYPQSRIIFFSGTYISTAKLDCGDFFFTNAVLFSFISRGSRCKYALIKTNVDFILPLRQINIIHIITS